MGENGARADFRLCAQELRGQWGAVSARWYDLGAANAQLTVQAQALGLVVHQAAGVERDKARATFNVPDEFDIVTGIVLGYQGDPDSLPEELPEREREPRARKSLGDIVFSGAFGTPARL